LIWINGVGQRAAAWLYQVIGAMWLRLAGPASPSVALDRSVVRCEQAEKRCLKYRQPRPSLMA